MKIFIGRGAVLKLAIIFLFVAIVVFVSFLNNSQRVLASASGPSPSHTNAPGESNCTACHVDFPVNSGTGSVNISGMPHSFIPGQHIPITVTTSQEDGVVYGFQLTAVDGDGHAAGTWTLQDTIQTQIVEGFVGPDLRQYVEHTFAGIVPTAFGSKSWTVVWNAPAAAVGKVSFYAAGNAANGNGETSGDFIYTTSRGTVGNSALSDSDSVFSKDIVVNQLEK